MSIPPICGIYTIIIQIIVMDSEKGSLRSETGAINPMYAITVRGEVLLVKNTLKL